MNLRNSEIIEWVEALDVRDALESIPDTSNIYNFAVQDRAELVRTAIGVTLLEHLEEAEKDVSLTVTSLETLGIIKEDIPEIIDETKILITERDFQKIAFQISYGNGRVDSRLWLLLRREHSEFFTDSNIDPADPRKAISLANLRELFESGQLENTRNLGPALLRLALGVVTSMTPSNI